MNGGGGKQGGMRPVRTGRMPQAPASLLVQMPPDELKRLVHDPHALNNLHGAGPSINSRGQNTTRTQTQASDVALLAASLQERRQREAQIFMWQQHLIASGGGGVDGAAVPIIDRSLLKRALTQLSLPAWLQVLQERHLADRCAYPTCNRPPIKPHLSSRQRNPSLPLDAPRYRISLRRRAIERDERDDAGGQNSFCSNSCWRRGEWVSRWVLNGGRPTRQVQQQVSDESFGSAIRDAPIGFGEDVDEGGHWERVMNEEHWTEIELLEDLEEKGEVDRLSEDEEQIKAGARVKVSPLVKDSSGSGGAHDVLQGQANDVARERGQRRTKGAGTAKGFLDMLDSLVIQERSAEQRAATQATPQIHIRLPAERDDVLGELSTRSASGGMPSLASAIRQSSRFEKEDDEGDVSMGDDAQEDEAQSRPQMTDEQRRRKKEEDDLFEQAWMAMSEEKAKGTWEDG